MKKKSDFDILGVFTAGFALFGIMCSIGLLIYIVSALVG